jgi:hypothetical protein
LVQGEGVPYDLRSEETMSYEDSLVGFTREVDNSTLNMSDYVRVKLVARNVSKVPGVAEGAIVPYLYDLFFEREVVDEQALENTSVQVQVNETERDHPSSAKKGNVMDPSSSS